MHVMLELPSAAVEAAVLDRAAAAGLAVGDLGSHWHAPGSRDRGGLVVGYATPGEGAYSAAVDMLVRTLRGTVV
jgi:GntR family transcriptional regulator/MocR family aminotransferase